MSPKTICFIDLWHFLLYATSCWPWYHPPRSRAVCFTLHLGWWEVDGSYLPVASWSNLKSPGFQVRTATPVNLRPDFDVRKLWAAKIKIEENFLELSFILILLLFIKIPLLCFKKLWKNLSLGLQVGWMLLVFRLGNSIGATVEKLPPLFIFHRPNNKTSRHEDRNHPSFGIGICQRAHQGERHWESIEILMKYMADDR